MSYKEQKTYTESKLPAVSDAQPIINRDMSGNSDDAHEFRCPYCNVSYQHELITRVHVTRADDVDHLNYNGIMPECDIEVVDDDDNIVDTISRRPGDIDLTVLSAEDFPDDLSEQHRRILLVAAQNLHEESYTTISERVKEHLATHSIESPSYSTIRRVIRRFYRPDEHQNQSNSTSLNNKDTLSDLTAKQQAIVIARVLLPEESDTSIADRIGCAYSYPSQVYDQSEHIIDQLNSLREEGDSLIKTVCSELTKDDINELIQRGLMDELPVELDSTTKYQTGLDETTGRDEWGSPVDHPKTLRAKPDNPLRTAEPNSEDSHTDQVQLNDAVQKLPEDSTTERTSDETTSDEDSLQQIPRDEVIELQDKVAFLREMFDSSQLENRNTELVVALAQQVEERCDMMLHPSSQS